MSATARQVLRVTGFLVLLVVAGGAVLYGAFPGVVASGLQKAQRASLGLSRQEVTLPSGTVPYLEGGSGTPLVLLHGFAADKDSWFAIAGQLAERYRVIIPDLAGFGESTVDAGGDYRPVTQAGRVHEFLRALDLGPVHLAGWSMGGQIAGHLAHDHPEAVRSLVLIVTGGLATDTVTPRGRAMLAGTASLLATNRAELDELLTTVMEVPGPVPSVIKRVVLAETQRRRPTWDSVFAQMVAPESVSSLDGVAPGIAVPTLVFWGERDVLLHVAMGRRLAGRIPGALFVSLPDCGHGCPMSRPEETLRVILGFLDAH